MADDLRLASLVEALQWRGFETAMSELMAAGVGAIPALLSAVERGGAGCERAAMLLRPHIALAIPPLRERMRSSDPDVASLACRAVGELGGGFRLRSYHEAWASGDPARVEAQVRTLGVLDDAAALAPLLAAAGPAARAARTLVPDLIEALGRPEHAVRERAIIALWQLGDRRAARPLLALLESLPPGEVELRRTAIFGLRWIGAAEATPALLALAADEAAEARVREAALDALGHLADAAGVRELLALRPRLRGGPRHALLRAIGESGDPAALPALLEDLESRDERTREAASYGLEYLGDRRALDALRAHLVGPRREPRRVRKVIQWSIWSLAQGTRAATRARVRQLAEGWPPEEATPR